MLKTITELTAIPTEPSVEKEPGASPRTPWRNLYADEKPRAIDYKRPKAKATPAPETPETPEAAAPAKVAAPAPEAAPAAPPPAAKPGLTFAEALAAVRREPKTADATPRPAPADIRTREGFAALARSVEKAADKADVARLEEMLTLVLNRLAALEERQAAPAAATLPAAAPARPRGEPDFMIPPAVFDELTLDADEIALEDVSAPEPEATPEAPPADSRAARRAAGERTARPGLPRRLWS